MSLETWKQEFYPVSAEEAVVDAIAAVNHSIKKWEGLRPNTLANHLKGQLNNRIQWCMKCCGCA